MAVARYYDEDKNPYNAAFPGVPLRDIEDEEWELLPVWVQNSVDASPFYRKTKPQAAAASRRTAETDKET